MSNTCNANDINKPDYNIQPKDSIELKAGKGISIVTEETETKKVYTISYKEFSLPIVSLNSSVGVTQVGVNVPSVEFSGYITEGSNSIVRREMVPDKGLNLENPFSWTETNVLGTSAGLWPQYSGESAYVEAEDDEANVVKSNIGIEFRHIFYAGFSIKDTLSETDIKGLINKDLLTNIKSKYGSYTYNYSVVPAYIYWVFPADTPGINSAEEGPLPVPLNLDLPNVSVTELGITKTYRVVRTAVKTKYIDATIKLL